MESILQKDKTKCFLCGQNPCGDPLDKHHCFEGSLRSKSEEYGLTVYLHHDKCHIFGSGSVHKNAMVARELKTFAQMKAMDTFGWNLDEWIEIFHKNYIWEDKPYGKSGS